MADSAAGPLENVTVWIPGGKRFVRTDSIGRFAFDSVPPGRVDLSIRVIGYPHHERKGLLIEPGKTLRADVWMRPYGYVPAAQALLQTDSGGTGVYATMDGSGVATYPRFSIDFFRAVTAKQPDSNAFISPASAAFALAMTAGGASGRTWIAMSQTLGVDTMHQDRLGEQNAAELTSLAGQTGVQLSIANSIWAAEGRPFLPTFLSNVRRWYSAEVNSLVLHGRAAEERINSWASTATNGRITSVLADTLPDTASMVLVNAVYFKGKWIDPFDSTKTTPHKFTLPGGRVVTRELMTRWDQISYAGDTGVRIVRLPYQGGRIAMYVVLPDSGVPLARVVAELDADRWSSWMHALARRDVHLMLPRFRLESGADLNEPLMGLGMSIAFDCKQATFDRLLPREYLERNPTCIGDVVQKTFVEVNEQGTEAAAVTAVEVVLGTTAVTIPPPPIEFIVDHPFIVAIRDDRTGLLLFLGQITDPPQP